MSAAPAAKRARAPALDAAVSTLAVPGLGKPNGLFVLEDGNRLVSAGHVLRELGPSGLISSLAGRSCESGKQDGPGAPFCHQDRREVEEAAEEAESQPPLPLSLALVPYPGYSLRASHQVHLRTAPMAVLPAVPARR